MTTAHRPPTGSRGSLAAAVVAVLLVASGCGGTTEGAAAGSDADAGGEAPAGDRLAESTFDVEAVTVDGEPFDLAQLAASDVVLWFWAPW